MMAYFQERKERISAWLQELFRSSAGSFGRVNPLGRELGERLLRFALQGKMLRGGLVSLGAGLAHDPAREAVDPEMETRAGAAMELLQSGLLVHDDIMDRDTVRRGQPTIFYQYAADAERGGARDAYHLGEALGICAGDVAYFLAFEVLAGLPAAVAAGISGLCARELALVGVAQMQDVSWGAAAVEAGAEDILRLYTYKTGRYTFSLPLLAGALLAGGGPELLARLERVGECLGVLFQIRDDELGLFGDEQELGKPVGSDIREGKKTLFYATLLRRAEAETRSRLAGIFGNPGIGAEEICFVQSELERLGVRREVAEVAATYEKEARRLIAELPEGRSGERRLVGDLLRYTQERTR